MFFTFGTIFLVGVLVGYLITDLLGRPSCGKFIIDKDDSLNNRVTLQIEEELEKIEKMRSINLKVIRKSV